MDEKCRHLDSIKRRGTRLLLHDYCMSNYLSGGNELFNPSWCHGWLLISWTTMSKDTSRGHGRVISVLMKRQIIGLYQVKHLRRWRNNRNWVENCQTNYFKLEGRWGNIAVNAPVSISRFLVMGLKQENHAAPSIILPSNWQNLCMWSS